MPKDLRTHVWRLIGLTGSEPGILTLTDDRVAFTGDKGTNFNVPLMSVTGVHFPWYYFTGGFKMNIGAESYRISFIEPHNHYAGIRDAWEIGTEWKSAFAERKVI